MQENKEIKIEGMHNRFAGFNIPKEIIELEMIMGKPVYGSRGFTKMMLFAKEENINNDVIDHYMHIKPERQNEENNDEYKNRTRFQKALLKYRPYIYQFTNTKLFQDKNK